MKVILEHYEREDGTGYPNKLCKERGIRTLPLFNWSDKFSLNIQKIDQQNKKLASSINCLYETKQADKEVLDKVLDELVDFTKTHFKKEEELMEQCGYPDYTVHKSEHDKLVQWLQDMLKKHYSGNTNITADIAIFLSDWLAEHILVKDKKYGEYFLVWLLA